MRYSQDIGNEYPPEAYGVSSTHKVIDAVNAPHYYNMKIGKRTRVMSERGVHKSQIPHDSDVCTIAVREDAPQA